MPTENPAAVPGRFPATHDVRGALRGPLTSTVTPSARSRTLEPYTDLDRLALAPLRGEATERLLADLLGSDPSLDGLVELIGERSGGNPFFCEEIVQSLIEGGNLIGERGERGSRVGSSRRFD